MNNSSAEAFELKQTVDAWDTDYYHPVAQRYYDQAVPRMFKLLGVKSGETVLDAGCGPGVHAISAAKAGLKVKAIDLSEMMLAEARKRVEQAGVQNSVEFAREDLTHLSFPDGAFQHVFSWGVIIHIHDIERALDELIRIVAPGGRLALYLTNTSAWDHKIEALARFLVRKPLKGLERLPMGEGIWYDWKGEKLWHWTIDAKALTKYMELRGMKPIAHTFGEFSEIQLRLRDLYSRLRTIGAASRRQRWYHQSVPGPGKELPAGRSGLPIFPRSASSVLHMLKRKQPGECKEASQHGLAP